MGADLDEAKDEARSFADARGLPFFEDGAEPAQFEGYATIGRRSSPQAPPATGRSGRSRRKRRADRGHRPRARGPFGRVALHRCRREGGAGDGALVAARGGRSMRQVRDLRRRPGREGCRSAAVAELGEVVDRMLEVRERELARAVAAYAALGMRVEGAGAASLAALPQLTASRARSSSWSPAEHRRRAARALSSSARSRSRTNPRA